MTDLGGKRDGRLPGSSQLILSRSIYGSCSITSALTGRKCSLSASMRFRFL